MKYCTLTVLVMIMFITLSCKKDDPAEAYLRGGNSIVTTPEGNMLIAGFNVGESGSYDGYLVKVSPNGDILWSNSYGNSYTDGFYKVINAPGGGYLATGYSSIFSDNHTNLLLVKTDELGVKQWQSIFGGESNTQGFAVTATSDGGYVACGYIQDGIGNDRDIYIVKADASGEKVWEKRYGNRRPGSSTAVYDEAYDIIPVGDSTFYLTGSLGGNVNCCGNVFVMKIDANGDSLWTKSYGKGFGYSIIATKDNGIVIGGTIDTTGKAVYLLKTDTSGVKIWEGFYLGDGYDFGSTLLQTNNGGYAITGYAAKSGSSNQDVLLNLTDANGSLIWSTKYGGDNVDQGFGLIQHPDGGFSITGLSNTGGSYIFLNRTDETGVEVWQKNIK